MTTGQSDAVPARDPSDNPGDSADQAQDLTSRLEQEAIAAALAGHPHGDDELDRPAVITEPGWEDPLVDAEEGDSSDDPVHGGDDVTGSAPHLGVRELELGLEDEAEPRPTSTEGEGQDEAELDRT